MHAPVSTWYNETTRLYRVFEFFETRDRLAGFTDGNRTTGKININSIWDFQTFLALCDPQPGNSFTATDVQNIWFGIPTQKQPGLLGLRSPNYSAANGTYQIGPTNMAVARQVDRRSLRHFRWTGRSSVMPHGFVAPPPIRPQYASIRRHRALPIRSSARPASIPARHRRGCSSYPVQAERGDRGDNPYMNHQLLTKIFNNVTTRSNTFGVWLTVGFFEVKNDTVLPVQLGAEMNASEGRAVRHRMFAIIDRSVLANNPYPNDGGDAPHRNSRSVPPSRPDTTGVVPYWSIIN